MTESYPSAAATLVDIGEVSNFKASFFYNFFVPDEMVSEDVEVPDSLKQMPGESFDAPHLNNLSRRIPRFVMLNFKPINVQNISPSSDFQAQNRLNAHVKNFSIRDNFDKLILEDNFTSNSFISLEFSDSLIDNKLFLAVSGSVAMESSRFNAKRRQDIQSEIGKLQKKTTSALGSLMDGARLLNQETPPDIDSNFITKSLVRLDQLGASMIDEEQQVEKRDDVFDRIKDIKLNARINSAIIGDSIRSIVNAPVGTMADDFIDDLKVATSIQAAEVAGRSPGTLSLNNYESSLPAVFERESTGNGPGQGFNLIGYVIEKTAIYPDGTTEEKDPLILENINTGTTVDTNVVYGVTYAYAIRTVALVTISSTSEGTDDIIDATYMVTSKPISSVIECVEKVPPPPPADFNIIYDHQRRAPRLMWNFPVNTQRDIKQFQIFRRLKIADPFTLLKVYNFDDSEVKTQNYEQIFDSLIENMSSPTTFYDDYEFNRDGSFIYAVCCVDAHGLTSTLSPQFEISFNKYRNKLVKRLISTSGAPKAYPNLYLLQDTFVDVVKDSGHSQLTVYFDPEYLDVFNNNGEDLNLLATDRTDGKYKIQFINTDLQQAQTLDIVINDLRQSKESD